MDLDAVREQAEIHGNAVVAGDFRTAGAALTPEAQAQAPGVMKAMPNPLRSAEISKLEADGEECVAVITYKGDEGSNVVVSRWADQQGEPKIIDLSLG